MSFPWGFVGPDLCAVFYLLLLSHQYPVGRLEIVSVDVCVCVIHIGVHTCAHGNQKLLLGVFLYHALSHWAWIQLDWLANELQGSMSAQTHSALGL